MAFLLICAGWRNRTRPLLLFYLFCFVTLSKVSELCYLRRACTHMHAELIKLSTPQMSAGVYFLCFFHEILQDMCTKQVLHNISFFTERAYE